ncbi:MAG: hypothetical protein ISP45_03155 [Reyranella sp.]|nr:hypothetical protein [Reyranella sp.]
MTTHFSLRRSTGLLAATTIVTQAINGLMILAQSRLYVPAALGYLGNAVSIATILAPICTLQLTLSLPQQRDRLHVAEIGAAVLLSTATGIGLFATAFLLAGAHLGSVSPTLALVWPTALCIVPFIAAYDLARLLAARDGMFGAVGTQTVLLALSRALCQLVGGLVGGSVVFLILGETASRLTSLSAVRRPLMAVWQSARRERLHIVDAVRAQWRFPLISTPSTLLDNLGGYLPSVLIADMYGVRAAGWFFLAQRVISLPLLLMIQSTADVLQVRAVQIVNEKQADLFGFVVKAVAILVLIGIAVVLTLMAFVTYGWSLLFGPVWAEARTMCFALLLPGLFQMVTGPLSRILVVANRLGLKILFDISFLFAALTPLISFWGRAATASDAVWRIGTGYFFAHVLYIGLILIAARFPLETRRSDRMQ